MTVTITPTEPRLYEVKSCLGVAHCLTWDEVLGRIAMMKPEELNGETPLDDLLPDTVTITVNRNYYEVICNGQITKNLCWDEMLAQVVNLIHPQLKKPWFNSQLIPLLPEKR